MWKTAVVRFEDHKGWWGSGWRHVGVYDRYQFCLPYSMQ